MTLGALEKIAAFGAGAGTALIYAGVIKSMSGASQNQSANHMTEPKALPAPNQALQPSWYGYDVEPPEQAAVPLAHYLWILRRHRWKIAIFVFACVTAT
jgi:hypothetical protein